MTTTPHIQPDWEKFHKPGCKMNNISCLVIHPDGICPGPYGRCTCEEITWRKPQWEIDFDSTFVESRTHRGTEGFVRSDPQPIIDFIRSLLSTTIPKEEVRKIVEGMKKEIIVYGITDFDEGYNAALDELLDKLK